MPVMMPGSAIGSTNSSEIASRPKNSAARQRARRQRAKHQGDEAVAIAATCTDSPTAPAQMSARSQATANQCSVRPGGGNGSCCLRW